MIASGSRNPWYDLIFRATEKIEMNYLKAVARGESAPVVFALDLRDTQAREIVDRLGEGELAGRILEERRGPDVSPIVVAGLPRALACSVADEAIPWLPTALAVLDPHQGYLAIAVTAGGALVAVMPAVIA